MSKGGVDSESDAEDGVAEAIKDELGIDIEVHEKLGENEYVANHPEKGQIRKQVSYFLAESEHQDLNLSDSGGLDDAKWFKLADILDLNFYDDILPIVTKGVTKIAKITELAK